MDIKEYISSGVLEQYVLGDISKDEKLVVEQMAITYPEIKAEIVIISNVLEQFALDNAVAPSRSIKPFIMATIDFMERMEKGEAPSFPPKLNEASQVSDFEPWLHRSDMINAHVERDLYAKIIGYTPQITTAIVWIKGEAPIETHHETHEKFLIVEGTCNIIVEDKVHQLVPGNYFTIPLHKRHQVIVTSAVTCKVILQRIAA